jgi:integrase
VASRSSRRRGRVGAVSFYFHHGAWWLYFREGGKVVRRKAASERSAAERVAAQINAQLASASPTLLSFEPISVQELRQRFLDFHEHVLNSTLGTVRRYRAATAHLETFALGSSAFKAHEIKADVFAAYLRNLETSPNGHANTAKRRLRHKGIQFILETCRTLYAFAAKRRHLPPYSPNPFAELPLGRFRIEDAKPIFLFDADTEFEFLEACDAWSFSVHFLLAKTGIRVGELVHLMVEDLDLESGWLRVRNKPALGWRVKTGAERAIPLIGEAVILLRKVIGDRKGGLVFLRRKFSNVSPPLAGDLSSLEEEARQRLCLAERPKGRIGEAAVCRSVWRDAGAIKRDYIRTDFLRRMRTLGRSDSTCPKSWRHTFATLLQDANVDPLVRQIVMGHSPSSCELKTTANYTHTRRETMRRQIEGALRLWPRSLQLVSLFYPEQEAHHDHG